MRHLLIALILFCHAPIFAATNSARVAGYWEGKLQFGAASLRVLFNIEAVHGDSLTGTMDSPDQGAAGIPLTSVRLAGDTLMIQVASVEGTFNGIVTRGDSVINGAWRQSAIVLPLTLRRTKSASVVRRPQEPQKPYPYNEEEVTVRNTDADISLAGTLTTPRTGIPSPAVVLITGSGPQDRNETVFGHRPFLVLADYLTRHGIAVLRVDDRGVGGSTGNTLHVTMEDFAGDILACVNYLKTRPEIAHELIGLIGHSEGGTVAPIVAQRTDDVRFLVLMAGTGLPGEKILYLQDSLIAKAAGLPDAVIARERKRMQEIYAMIRAEADSTTLAKKISSYYMNAIDSLGGDEARRGSDVEKAIEAQVRVLTTPWFRHFLVYDPRPALRGVHCPVLAINGARDLQVPPKENLHEIERALREGGNEHVTIREFPNLNHLFQHARTGAVTEYGTIEETIAPEVLETITQWITKTVGALKKD